MKKKKPAGIAGAQGPGPHVVGVPDDNVIRYEPETMAASSLHFVNQERSDWQCELFGCGPHGIVWNPAKDHVPNWFWRQMQYLAFGNKWVRKDK